MFQLRVLLTELTRNWDPFTNYESGVIYVIMYLHLHLPGPPHRFNTVHPNRHASTPYTPDRLGWDNPEPQGYWLQLHPETRLISPAWTRIPSPEMYQNTIPTPSASQQSVICATWTWKTISEYSVADTTIQLWQASEEQFQDWHVSLGNTLFWSESPSNPRSWPQFTAIQQTNLNSWKKTEANSQYEYLDLAIH
jgi:hypothetical protein